MACKPISKGGGKWLIRACCGYEGTEKKMINRTIALNPAMTAKAQLREAEKQTAMLEAEYQNGKITAGKQITLASFSKQFMEDYVQRKGLSPKTVAGYRQLLDSRILPMLGHMRLRDIKPMTLNRFYSSIEKDAPKGRSKGAKLSGTYLAKYHRLLHNILERAVRWQLIAINPAANVDPPAPDTEEFTVYDAQQSLRLLEALDKERTQWRVLVTLALYSQMRRGELIALDWGDVSPDFTSIDIRRNVVYVPGQGSIIKAPKTKAGARRITLSSTASEALKELKRSQNQQRLALGDGWVDSKAIFTQWNGERMNVESPTKWFGKFLKANGLPHIRFHDLRHTGASLLITDAGLDVETVKKRLGHARASTTMDIYGHAFAAHDSRPADALDSLLNRPGKAAK